MDTRNSIRTGTGLTSSTSVSLGWCRLQRGGRCEIGWKVRVGIGGVLCLVSIYPDERESQLLTSGSERKLACCRLHSSTYGSLFDFLSLIERTCTCSKVLDTSKGWARKTEEYFHAICSTKALAASEMLVDESAT